MNDYEYDVKGAPVVYTNLPPEPNNPLNRPKVGYIKPIVAIGAFILLNTCLGLFFVYGRVLLESQILFHKTVYSVLWIVLDLLFVFMITKRAIIWLIHLYQRYAPDEVRLKCVFEPSCSEYMLSAISKYGVIKGVVKGVDRLFRCHPPNGGCDEP
jgi:putative membrane protein insertion efficiency factor